MRSFISLLIKSLAALLAVTSAADAQTNTNAPFPVTIQVDAAKTSVLHPIWRFFGADEPNYAYMKDGKKLITELGQMRPSGTVFFRTHNLLNSGDGTPALKWGSTGAYSEDANGNAIYNWTIVDRIFDTYLEHGVRPYAQIGFMPKELSSAPTNVPYQHNWHPGINYGRIYTAWSYPPKDYAKWGEVVYQWVKHCVEKYGKAEVESWYWEVWNEPNISYWHGTPQEFYRLHDYAIDAVRRALPTAKVGGPDCAGAGQFLSNFIEHCLHGTNNVTGKIGTPMDFISFHAKGAPSYVTNSETPHVRMGIGNQLSVMNDAFRRIANFPEAKDKPIVIGESDPDGCAACLDAQYGYRQGLQFASYTAASLGHESDLSDRHGVNLEGALNWAFEFEDQPLFTGYRVLATGGIDLPVFNAFRMFNRLSGQRLAATSDHGVALDGMMRGGVRSEADVESLASFDGHKLAVVVWHYHDDDIAGPDAAVTVDLSNLPAAKGALQLQQFRIDENHSDAFAVWKHLGSPAQPTPEQYTQLETAGKLATMGTPTAVTAKDSKATVQLQLPRQGVALLEITGW